MEMRQPQTPELPGSPGMLGAKWTRPVHPRTVAIGNKPGAQRGRDHFPVAGLPYVFLSHIFLPRYLWFTGTSVLSFVLPSGLRFYSSLPTQTDSCAQPAPVRGCVCHIGPICR